jgi:hydrogenase maturation factor
MNLYSYFFIACASAFCLTGRPAIAQETKVDPIIIKAEHNILLRSFIDLDGGKRVTHAISIGSPLQVHYTYDADNGQLVLLWKGGFLNATPMWHDRGDGSSRPLGKAIQIGDGTPQIQRLATLQSEFKKDTVGSGFKPKGYTLDASGLPTFKYLTYGLSVKDATRVIDGGLGIRREIEPEGSANDLYLCLAKANVIEQKDGKYVIVDKAYSISVADEAALKPIIRTIQGTQELLVPFKSKIVYAILFNQ